MLPTSWYMCVIKFKFRSGVRHREFRLPVRSYNILNGSFRFKFSKSFPTMYHTCDIYSISNTKIEGEGVGRNVAKSLGNRRVKWFGAIGDSFFHFLLLLNIWDFLHDHTSLIVCHTCWDCNLIVFNNVMFSTIPLQLNLIRQCRPYSSLKNQSSHDPSPRLDCCIMHFLFLSCSHLRRWQPLNRKW